ncbi:molybdopterin-guanine dinucleotide biosynthesis protein B [Gracilibacillus sp. YIM 98692]|uniref:molybdopterin-guanine dinucleotide biosynthesis protein B n=1 Tax=Gracilibacillus sp. YIM 98692 TaxID=2663532 RepID=UPI0013D60278|nr:molybdopterin-guanine dinucleotide biosynthesis protein B [Gracilibacillus sp. YIM 98692]
MMYVIQVVGYKNSGKTTLVSKWIKYLQAKGLSTSTIKHHGHGGKPDTIKTKDTEKHMEAGAGLTSVLGEKEVFLNARLDQLPVENILDIYYYLSIDVVFIEGFKSYPFPKVVMLRDENDFGLLNTLENIQAVYTMSKFCQSYDDVFVTQCKMELITEISDRLDFFQDQRN